MLKYLLAVALLLTPTAALATDAPDGWTHINTDDEGISLFIRDQDWLKGRSHQTSAKVWVRMQYPKSKPTYEAFMIYYEINCVSETFRLLGGNTYYKDGTNEQLKRDISPSLIVPGTNMDGVRMWVCIDPEQTGSSSTPITPPEWNT